jgi:hypothetical protein
LTLAPKIVVLEVDADKADELVSALSKRDYISVVDLDRDEKKKRKLCPCCGHKFAREVICTVNQEILETLLPVIYKMKVSKSVILVNKDNPIARLPEYERPRCVEMSGRLIEKATTLRMLQAFKDGSRLTYFVTGPALAFLANREPLSPSTVVVVHGEVVERSGTTMIEDVKFKDRVRHDSLIYEARRAVAELPKAVVEFVEKGQMSLV